MKKKERIQHVKAEFGTHLHSEQLFCLTIYLLVFFISTHFCDKDAAHTHAQGMACHGDAPVCLQTLLFTILPWLYTIAGKFAAVLMNCSRAGNQQASHSPAGSTDQPHSPGCGRKHTHNKHTRSEVPCIWWALVNKGSLVLKEIDYNKWLREIRGIRTKVATSSCIWFYFPFLSSLDITTCDNLPSKQFQRLLCFCFPSSFKSSVSSFPHRWTEGYGVELYIRFGNK